jgi:demethylmenaquinone methyltransferase/2-methoxy-6-polyprenyl-1,4-benzoquinol methylase
MGIVRRMTPDDQNERGEAGPGRGASTDGRAPDGQGPTTHFGAATIPEAEKAGRVHGVFSSVAARYDLMNDLMSAGIHRYWKDRFVDWLAPRRDARVLDMAGGTGDVAFRIRRRQGASGHVTVCDLTGAMLEEGRRRAEAERLEGLDWVEGDAMALPFPDRAFDAYTIAFGIRNVTRPEVALAEARRVLKPGGRFLCLEFSRVGPPALRAIYDAYSFGVIPPLGQAIAGDRASYQYLVESIRRFPEQERFAAMIREAGLSRVEHRDMTFGVVAMHSAHRL